jgi:hypothetical protein
MRNSYCPTVLLSYCPTVLLSYCPTVLLSNCLTVLLSHCPTVLLSYCPTVLLSYCLTVFTVLLSYRPTVLLSYCLYLTLKSVPNVLRTYLSMFDLIMRHHFFYSLGFGIVTACLVTLIASSAIGYTNPSTNFPTEVLGCASFSFQDSNGFIPCPPGAQKAYYDLVMGSSPDANEYIWYVNI